MILPPPTTSALHHIILFDSLALPLEAYMGSPALIRELGSLPVWMLNPHQRVQQWESITCGAHCLFFLYSFIRRRAPYYCSFSFQSMTATAASVGVAQNVLSLDYHVGRQDPKQCDSLVLNFLSSLRSGQQHWQRLWCEPYCRMLAQ